MGWELRHGDKWYLYRNRRVNGKPRKEYLAAQNDRFGPGFGEIMAHDLHRLQRRQAKVRRLKRKVRTIFRQHIDEVLTSINNANSELRTASDALMTALGYHKHHRGEWRMRRDLKILSAAITALEKQAAVKKPLVRCDAPADDPEAVELFAKARSGDVDAQARVHALIRDRDWVNWIGDLGRQATQQLIVKAAGGDAVWEEGIVHKVNALRKQLLGECPTVLEELLVRRAVNGWVAVHALELELTVRPPVNARDRAHLDAALTRAQKRFTEALRELARVRRLQAPRFLAQLNLATTQTVVNGNESGATAKV